MEQNIADRALAAVDLGGHTRPGSQFLRRLIRQTDLQFIRRFVLQFGNQFVLVKCHSNQDGISLVATNLRDTLVFTLPAEVTTPFTCCLPAALLAKLAKPERKRVEGPMEIEPLTKATYSLDFLPNGPKQT